MATMHLGRKETIIFPPHGAVYTYGAVFFALILTGLFVYLRFTFGNTPLQRFYTPIYIRSSVAGGVSASRKRQVPPGDDRRSRNPAATGHGRGRERRQHTGTGNETASACALQVRLAGWL
jgi:hypothetical protein